MNLTTAIIYGLFVGIICFIFGLYRGWKTYEKPCPKEDLEAYYDAGYQMGYEEGQRVAAQRQVIDQLDEIFDDDGDDNRIIDCGEY